MLDVGARIRKNHAPAAIIGNNSAFTSSGTVSAAGSSIVDINIVAPKVELYKKSDKSGGGVPSKKRRGKAKPSEAR